MTSTLFDRLKSRADKQAQAQYDRDREAAPKPETGLGLGLDAEGRPILAGFVSGQAQDSVTYSRPEDYKAPDADEPLTPAQREGLRALAVLSGVKS